MAGRRLFLKTIGGLTLIGAGTASYGLWFEPGWRLRVAEYRPRLPNWPASTPLTIAALSDIHANEPYMPLSRLAEIVEATNALNPDLVVLLGDYPGNGHWVKPIPVAETAQVLRGLRARHGVHTVLGEHDWWDDVQVQRNRRGLPRLARTLAEQGRLSVLHNAAVKTGSRGQGFWVAGCGSLWAFNEGEGRYFGANDLTRTLAQVQDRDPVILLCHEPDIFPQVPADRVALTLAGHTHGGQVRLLGWSPIVPSAYGQRFAYGHVEEAGKHMIVSGGLGTVNVPVRLGVPPEITLIRLGGAA